MSLRATPGTAAIAGVITALGMSLVELVRESVSSVLWSNAIFLGGGALLLALPAYLLVVGRTYYKLRAEDFEGAEYAAERRAALGRGLCWLVGGGVVSAVSSFF